MQRTWHIRCLVTLYWYHKYHTVPRLVGKRLLAASQIYFFGTVIHHAYSFNTHLIRGAGTKYLNLLQTNSAYYVRIRNAHLLQGNPYVWCEIRPSSDVHSTVSITPVFESSVIVTHKKYVSVLALHA
jgi:hypothetical protein